MDPKIFETTIASIQEKLGETESAKIADDLGVFKSAQAQALTEKQALEQNIEKITRDRDDMQKANARLLQQIPMGIEDTNINQPAPQEQRSEFNPATLFDEHGNLRKDK